MPAEAKTQSNPSPLKLEQAINLAKAGRKAEAGAALRQVVALQPMNLAAWLWLSAVTEDKAEAEAALHQAKQINPTHHSLARAEQWLIHRFSDTSETRQKQPLQTRPSPVTLPDFEVMPSGKSLKVSHSIGFFLVLIAILLALLVLLGGIILEVSSTAKAHDEWPYLIQKTEAEVPEKIDLHETERAALEARWDQQDWAGAVALLEQLHKSRPESELIEEKLAQAYLQQGITLRTRGFVAEARLKFEQSLALEPRQPLARQELYLASTYLSGTGHYQAGQWEEAIADLEQVRAEDSSYIHSGDLLYSAYYNLGLAYQGAGKFYKARRALESAITLRPDLSEPRRLLAEVEFALAPQTPLEVPLNVLSLQDRLILVGIAEQRMLVYEKGQKVFDFVVSTGEPGRDTVPGDFEILNKIDVAYAATWNLDMPYWMGIYWAGPLQNGIHSLPIVKHTGYKLWDGYLGQRVSYGCVILSDEDAATLYDWTEVGTKVKIVSSLAAWSQAE